VDPSGLDFWEWLAAKIGPDNIAKLDTVLGDPRTGWFAQVTDATIGGLVGYVVCRRDIMKEPIKKKMEDEFREACKRNNIDPKICEDLLTAVRDTRVFPIAPNRCLAWVEAFEKKACDIRGTKLPLEGPGLKGGCCELANSRPVD
jgi:hypothetical protein